MTMDAIRAMTAGLEPEGLGFDDDGSAAVAVGEGLTVGIDCLEASGDMLLHADLGSLPSSPAAAALTADLLDETLRLAAADIGTLGIDRATGTVVFAARRALAGLDAEAFEDWLGDFSETALIWAARIAAHHPPHDGEDRDRPADEDDLELDFVLLGTA